MKNPMTAFRSIAFVFFASAAALALAACGVADEGEHERHDDEEYERGTHGGRLLEDGDVALEVTIYENGSPPRFRLYPYRNGEPVSSDDVKAQITLDRLGGDKDEFSFAPEGDYLTSPQVVREPHSFDVSVTAAIGGDQSAWTYQSYEGRTEITNAAATEAGIVTEKAGPAIITETVDVLGRVDFAPGAQAVLRGRFPGQVLSVSKTVGDAVAKGEVIARIESNESLQAYEIRSPIDGVVVERNTNPGDVAGDAPLFTVGDLRRLIVDFHVFASDLDQVKPGQDVSITTVDDAKSSESIIQTFLPAKETATQTIIARAPVPNDDGAFMPGMTVRGDIVVNAAAAPLAVRADALQRFRDFTVVFEKIGETYEVRMLELGRRNAEWAEVLGGVEPGAEYVAQNSFLIKADIEKSGASHDH